VLQAYNAALGLYQPATAYMLILASQKDPAEHIHELRTFSSIPNEHMRCFAIDSRLGRHSSALKHIVAAGAERATEARAFARKHGLLRPLLQLLHGQLELRAAAMLEVGRVRALTVSCRLGIAGMLHGFVSHLVGHKFTFSSCLRLASLHLGDRGPTAISTRSCTCGDILWEEGDDTSCAGTASMSRTQESSARVRPPAGS
jgi:hypothetical protein